MILPGFLIGIAATAATWLVVRLFPKQKYPKDKLWLLLSGLEARTSSLLWDGVYCMSKLMSQKRWEGGCSRWDIVLQLYGIDFGGGLFGSWFLPT